MTTNNHTAITTGAAANASTINTPLGQLDSKMGNVSALTTTTTTSLVAAVDELHGEHGTLSSLTTTAKSTFVAAINEVDANADTAGTNASTALTRIGTLASLTTDEKTNLVGAVNEVDSHADTAQTTANTASTNASTALTRIGTLGSLTTTEKSNLVGAVNEVDANADTAGTNASTALTNIGTLGSLNTTNKTNLVAAVNELEAEINTLQSDILDKGAVNLTAASTVATTALRRVYRVSGGANIQTITPQSGDSTEVVHFICLGTWNLITGGNIARAYEPAINEVVTLVYDNVSDLWYFQIEDLPNLSTTAKGNLVDALNEVYSNVGTLASLNTTVKTSAVAAINEVNTLAGWDNAAVVNKTAAGTLTLNAGVSRYNVSGATAISTINWSAGIPTVIYLMDSGAGQMTIFYDDGNIVGAGLSGENTHGNYAVVCLVYNSGTWQKVI